MSLQQPARSDLVRYAPTGDKINSTVSDLSILSSETESQSILDVQTRILERLEVFNQHRKFSRLLTSTGRPDQLLIEHRDQSAAQDSDGPGIFMRDSADKDWIQPPSWLSSASNVEHVIIMCMFSFYTIV